MNLRRTLQLLTPVVSVGANVVRARLRRRSRLASDVAIAELARARHDTTAGLVIDAALGPHAAQPIRRHAIGHLLAGITLGKFAGAIGTAAMDAVWYARYRRGGGTTGPVTWEFGGLDGWDEVSSPGQVGERVLRLTTGKQPPDEWAQATQNVVHWATGIGWGAMFGAVVGWYGKRAWLYGPVLGVVAWGASYVILPLLRIYRPMWRYDIQTLAKDLRAHLVYGTTTGIAVSMMSRR